MKRKIALLLSVVIIASLFGGCTKSKVNITLDKIIKANSYESLVKEYGVFKLEYDYGSEKDSYIEYVSSEDVLKVTDNRSAYIYYGEKCCYYKSGDEMYALLKNYKTGESYKNLGNILESNNELYHEELKEIKKTDDGYLAVSILNGKDVVLDDGQKLTADDEIEYTMTLNKKLTVTALTVTVKYATITETLPEEISETTTQSTSEITSKKADKKSSSSTTRLDIEEEIKKEANVGYQRRLYTLKFEDANDEDYLKFEPYVSLKSHANPTNENTVSVNVFESTSNECKTYFCTKGDKIYVSDNGYYKDESRKEKCLDNAVIVNENINIYL